MRGPQHTSGSSAQDDPGDASSISVSLPSSQPDEETAKRVNYIAGHQEAFAGPLPPPRMLAEYDTVAPDLAATIVGMAQKEQLHRHRMDTRSLHGFICSKLFGQFAAFLLGLLGVGGGIYLVSAGKGLEGFGTFFFSLAGLLGVFIVSKKLAREEEPEPDTPDPAMAEEP